MSIAFGLLILRVLIGLVQMAHGSQKLFGWFGGHGLKGTARGLATKGFTNAWFWALLGGLGEFGGGLLLLLGLLTPLGAIAVFASMLMAVVKFHGSKGFWGAKGGYEYPLTLMLLGFALGLTGPGAYSLDALLNIQFPILLFWLGIIAAIVVDGIGIVTSRQPAQAKAEQATA